VVSAAAVAEAARAAAAKVVELRFKLGASKELERIGQIRTQVRAVVYRYIDIDIG